MREKHVKRMVDGIATGDEANLERALDNLAGGAPQGAHQACRHYRRSLHNSAVAFRYFGFQKISD